VVGFDTDRATAETAAHHGAVDDVADTLGEAVAGADLAVVAVPVGQLASQVRSVLEASGEECTVTDVGSTKTAVCAAAGGSPRFIGGHPVCGSHARGPEHASAGLFEGATWFLSPLTQSEPRRYRLVHGFVGDLGATPVAIDPSAHDRLVALTSHLPHVLANVLVNQAGATRIDGHEPLSSAGGSLRDMTRVAGANPRISLEQVEAALGSGDAGFLARWIGEAALNRRGMITEAYGDPGLLQRLRVHVPDRPGVLAGITQALGAERINIEDFELHHQSPERGGTLMVLVAGEQEAQRAAALLEAQGYGVVVSPVVDE
jgi:prephenate dehydrogenase